MTPEQRTQLLLDLTDREIARGNLSVGYEELAVLLSAWTGEWQTVGVVAGLFDRAAWRQRVEADMKRAA